MPQPRNVTVRDQIIQGRDLIYDKTQEYVPMIFPISFGNLGQDAVAEYNLSNFNIQNLLPNMYPPYNILNFNYEGETQSMTIPTGFYTAEGICNQLTLLGASLFAGTTLTFTVQVADNGLSKIYIYSSAAPITVLPSPSWFILGCHPHTISTYTTSGFFPFPPAMNHVSAILIDADRISPGQAFTVSGVGMDLMATIPVEVNYGHQITYFSHEEKSTKIRQHANSPLHSFALSFFDPRGHILYADHQLIHTIFMRIRSVIV